MSMTDTRIVYGVTCTWWDSIDKTGRTKPRPQRVEGAPFFSSLTEISIPCCPHCGGILYEKDHIDRWWHLVDKQDAKDPGYRKFIEWLRGRCLPGYGVARAIYRGEGRVTRTEALEMIKTQRDSLIDPVAMLNWTWLYVIVNHVSDEEWDELVGRAAEVLSR